MSQSFEGNLMGVTITGYSPATKQTNPEIKEEMLISGCVSGIASAKEISSSGSVNRALLAVSGLQSYQDVLGKIRKNVNDGKPIQVIVANYNKETDSFRLINKVTADGCMIIDVNMQNGGNVMFEVTEKVHWEFFKAGVNISNQVVNVKTGKDE